MRRNRVRLTESQLHRVIKESVKKVLKEGTKPGANPMGAMDNADDRGMMAFEYGQEEPGTEFGYSDYQFNASIREAIDDIAERYGISTKRAMDMVIGKLNSWSKQYSENEW